MKVGVFSEHSVDRA